MFAFLESFEEIDGLRSLLIECAEYLVLVFLPKKVLVAGLKVVDELVEVT